MLNLEPSEATLRTPATKQNLRPVTGPCCFYSPSTNTLGFSKKYDIGNTTLCFYFKITGIAQLLGDDHLPLKPRGCDYVLTARQLWIAAPLPVADSPSLGVHRQTR